MLWNPEVRYPPAPSSCQRALPPNQTSRAIFPPVTASERATACTSLPLSHLEISNRFKLMREHLETQGCQCWKTKETGGRESCVYTHSLSRRNSILTYTRTHTHTHTSLCDSLSHTQPRIVSAGEQSEWEMWLTIKISFNISESRLWRQAARTDAEDGVTLRATDVSLRPGDASSNDEPRKLQAGKMPAANLLFHSAFLKRIFNRHPKFQRVSRAA